MGVEVRMRVKIVEAVVVAVVVLTAAGDGVAGKYSRGLQRRGDVTGLSPKVDAWAFIDDEARPPHEMVLLVDTWSARGQRYPGVLPLEVALDYEGSGPAVDVSPQRFRLAWEDEGVAVDVGALDDASQIDADAIEEGLRRDAGRLRSRTPLSFGGSAPQADVRLRSPRSQDRRSPERPRLSAGTWFSSTLWFPLPTTTDLWERRFDLTFLGDADRPLARVAFRIERESSWQQGTFRRARREIRREDRSGAHASFAR
jgi:hypothetical protein